MAGLSVHLAEKPRPDEHPMITWFCYARHADVPRLLSSGWVLASDLGPVHGQWSALLQWAEEGDPPLTRITNEP